MKSLMVSTLALLCSMSFAVELKQPTWREAYEKQITMRKDHEKNGSMKEAYGKHGERMNVRYMPVEQRTELAKILYDKVSQLEAQLGTTAETVKAKIQQKIDTLKKRIANIEEADPVMQTTK